MSITNQSTVESDLPRIRWRCRRGMRELDQLFGRYVDQCWLQDSEQQRQVFLRLLDCEDDKLWKWFMGYETAPDEDIQILVTRIRGLPI